MTPADFRAWRARLGLTQAQAARALDIGRRTILRYEQDPVDPLDEPPYPIPRAIALACKALESGLSV